MDKNWSCLAVAANVYSDVQIQFLWSSYLWDSFAQEKSNFTSPALVIANHNFNKHISILNHVLVPGPQWYHKCFQKPWLDGSEIQVWRRLALSLFPSFQLALFANFHLFVVFLGSSVAIEYKSKDQQDYMFFANSQCALYWSFIYFAVLPPS